MCLMYSLSLFYSFILPYKVSKNEDVETNTLRVFTKFNLRVFFSKVKFLFFHEENIFL